MAGRIRANYELAVANKKHYSKAELEQKKHEDVSPKSDDLKPSPHLPKRLHKKFNYIVEQFKEFNILSNVDSDALSRYLIANDNYWQINDQMEDMDYTDEDYAKLQLIQKRYFDQALSLSKELGLTMVSRSRLVNQSSKEDKKEQTDDEKLFGRELGIM